MDKMTFKNNTLKNNLYARKRRQPPTWTAAATVFFTVAVVISPNAVVAASECPFLTALGKSSADVSGDLWELVLGGGVGPTTTVDDNKYRDLRRYDHYKAGSAYKYQRNHSSSNVYSNLSDIWLCLACAVGWTVWLVSATRSHSQLEPSIFESQDSKKVHGNVLQVTLGQDPDGTGIPIYHTLVDYVVESNVLDEEPLQVRKCFSTRKLLEEGFANVQVLILLEDPTKSILMDDYIQDRMDRNQRQLEPPDIMYAIIVYLIAAILIVTSLVGGLHAYVKLDPEHYMWGKISLGVGAVLIYPIALLLYWLLIAFYRWAAPFVERPGVIIHGAQRYWNHQCGGGLNPLEVMGTFDTNGNDMAESTTSGMPPPKIGSNRIKRISPTNRNQRHKRSDTVLSAVIEHSFSTAGSHEGHTDKTSRTADIAHTMSRKSSLYPNAGCGFGNFNVLMPIRLKNPELAQAQPGTDNATVVDKAFDYDISAMSMSSMSSVGSGVSSFARPKLSNNTASTENLAALRASLQVPELNDSSSVRNNYPGLVAAAAAAAAAAAVVNTTRSSGDSCNFRPRHSSRDDYMPPPPSSIPTSSTTAGQTDSHSAVSSLASSTTSQNNKRQTQPLPITTSLTSFTSPTNTTISANGRGEEPTPLASNRRQKCKL